MKTVREKIYSYLRKCKTARTVLEIARGAGVNKNTCRKVINEMWYDKIVESAHVRKCSVSNITLHAWALNE